VGKIHFVLLIPNQSIPTHGTPARIPTSTQKSGRFEEVFPGGAQKQSDSILWCLFQVRLPEAAAKANRQGLLGKD
jgi:hypothetical protein